MDYDYDGMTMDYDYDIVRYCDLYECDECPIYGDLCDGKEEDDADN